VFSKLLLLFFSFLNVFGKLEVHFLSFSPLLPLTEISLQPSAIPGGNPPEDWQSAMGWGDAGFEPGTAGQQSGILPLSHHTSLRATTLLSKLSSILCYLSAFLLCHYSTCANMHAVCVSGMRE
jgi:hypothetical protein